MELFYACLAVANLGLIFMHLGNARTAKRIGESPASPYFWAGVAGVMAASFGAAALL